MALCAAGSSCLAAVAPRGALSPAPGPARLVRREKRFDSGTHGTSYHCPEEPAKAGRKLEGPHWADVIGIRGFRYPNEQVDGRPEDQEYAVGKDVCRVRGLGQEAGDKPRSSLVSLLGLPINARGAAAGCQGKGCQPSPLRLWPIRK